MKKKKDRETKIYSILILIKWYEDRVLKIFINVFTESTVLDTRFNKTEILIVQRLTRLMIMNKIK